MKPVLIKAFIINSIIILLCGSGIIIFSTELINILFKLGTLDINLIRKCLIIITITYCVYSFNAVGYFSLLAIRHEKFVTNLVLLSGIASLFFIYVLSLKLGIIGACIGNIGYCLTLLLNSKAINKFNILRYTFLKVIYLPIIISIILSCMSFLYANFYLNVIFYFTLILLMFFALKKYFDNSYTNKVFKYLKV